MKSVLVVGLLCAFVMTVQSVALDAVCTKSSDCTTTNAYCKKELTPCAKGYCKCKSGYGKDISDNSCKPEKLRGVACSADTVCEDGYTCINNECKCAAGFEYSAKTKSCITTGKKVEGETCASETDCFNTVSGAMECVAATGSTTKYCRCKSGYTKVNYQCRAPYVKEACVSGVACAAMVTGIDSTMETPTCSSSTDKCACASSSTLASASVGGTSYHICLSAYTGTKKANGETCTASNQCKNHYCATCPGETSKECVSYSSDGVKTSGVGLMALLSVAIIFM